MLNGYPRTLFIYLFMLKLSDLKLPLFDIQMPQLFAEASMSGSTVFSKKV